MRIISGIYKGRHISSSRDLSIRPTTDRIKELIFNVLQDFPVGRTVIDIFAGSGNLGIEALSRGAAHVIFVEKSPASLSVLEDNLSKLRIPREDYSIVRQDALAYAATFRTAGDLFLIDPPFTYPPLQDLIDRIFKNEQFMNHALVVLEHEINNPLKQETENYIIFKQKKKGRSLISFIEKVAT
jgi:16S rRNA (guanine(966)-N(2))-methyltransferase RsmD